MLYSETTSTTFPSLSIEKGVLVGDKEVDVAKNESAVFWEK
jgi:hypothetical protein